MLTVRPSIGVSCCSNTSTRTRSLWSSRFSLKTTTMCMSMSITSSSSSSSSSSPTKTNTIVPAIIIGDDRVAGILQSMGDGNDLMIMPGEAIPTYPPGPIFVCCTVPGAKKVIKAIPLSRLKDLVFFQIGMIGTSLTIEDPGQVLFMGKSGKPDDQTTDINPDEFNAAYGKWASAIATRFESQGRPCKVLEKEAFQKQLLESLIFICAFTLVGLLNQCATVGAVEKEYRSEVAKLISELASAAAAEKGIVFEQGMEERVFAYSRVYPDMSIRSRYFEWRHGWFYFISKKAVAKGKPDPCPLHTEWLEKQFRKLKRLKMPENCTFYNYDSFQRK
ncbi:hypothetical protein AQUCO_06000048v1 [Aquilegia coerulea]|uniref:Uncharacterized protein n=1 Tax=Aquilegia coerulea TaxID=218851 RepID=A0A2G5CDQ7_AQUCA|nr:hypothetical protein AQUCO_06000048v1 [Aquilegia coerulea]